MQKKIPIIIEPILFSDIKIKCGKHASVYEQQKDEHEDLKKETSSKS